MHIKLATPLHPVQYVLFQIGMTRRIHRLSRRPLSSFPFISGPHQSRSARSTRDRAIIYALPTTILRNKRLFLLTYHMANGLFGSTSIALFSHNPDLLFSPLLFQIVPDEDVHYHSFCCCCCGCFLLVACGVITGPIPLSLKEKRRQRVSVIVAIQKLQTERSKQIRTRSFCHAFNSISWDGSCEKRARGMRKVSFRVGRPPAEGGRGRDP